MNSAFQTLLPHLQEFRLVSTVEQTHEEEEHVRQGNIKSETLMGDQNERPEMQMERAVHSWVDNNAHCGRHTFGTLRHDLTVEVHANASSSLAYDLVHNPGPVTFAEVTTE